MAKSDYYWLSENAYKKAVWHLETQITSLLQDTYTMHGYKEYAVQVAHEITEMAEQFGQVVRGKNVPIKRRKSERF